MTIAYFCCRMKAIPNKTRLDLRKLAWLTDQSCEPDEPSSKLFNLILRRVKSIGKQKFYQTILKNTITVLGKPTCISFCNRWSKRQPDPKPFMDGLPPCWPNVPLVDNQFPSHFDGWSVDSGCQPNKLFSCLFHKVNKFISFLHLIFLYFYVNGI